MPRDFAQVMVRIWGHPDVRALPPLQQWLYLQLWTHPQLNYAGVIEWKPARIAQLSAGSTGESISAVVPLLEERKFVVLDNATEELFVRPYFRFDGVLKQKNLAVSAVNAYSSIGSNAIRAAIVSELKKLKKESPDWAAWHSPQILDILKHPSVDPAADPGLDPGPKGQGHPGLRGEPTATATSTETASPSPRRPELPLSDAWAPTPEHYSRAKELGVDIVKEMDSFRLHAQTHDRRVANWNGAFTMWLKKAQPSRTSRKISPQDEWKYR